MMAVNVYHACIVGIFTTRLRRLFVCGPRRAKNNSSCAAFRCAMARERDGARARSRASNPNHCYYDIQGLALRGHGDNSTADLKTNRGNWQELIQFRAKTRHESFPTIIGNPTF